MVTIRSLGAACCLSLATLVVVLLFLGVSNGSGSTQTSTDYEVDVHATLRPDTVDEGTEIGVERVTLDDEDQDTEEPNLGDQSSSTTPTQFSTDKEDEEVLTTTVTVDSHSLVYHEDICSTYPCIQFCCPPGYRMINATCTNASNQVFSFPPVYNSTTLGLTEMNVSQENFNYVHRDPCTGDAQYVGPHFALSPEAYPEDQFKLLDDGSIYLEYLGHQISARQYCLTIVADDTEYKVLLCFDNSVHDPQEPNLEHRSSDESTAERHRRSVIGWSPIQLSTGKDNKEDLMTKALADPDILVQNGGFCSTHSCIPFCCIPGYQGKNTECSPSNEVFSFPPIYNSTTLNLTDVSVNQENFYYIRRDPCMGDAQYILNPEEYPEEEFKLLDNGSIYQVHFQHLVPPRRYCFAVLLDDNEYKVVMCFEDPELEESVNVTEKNQTDMVGSHVPVGMIISVPFLVATFVVYTIIPDLCNMHGRTLRCYVGHLAICYPLLAVVQMAPEEYLPDSFCLFLGTVIVNLLKLKEKMRKNDKKSPFFDLFIPFASSPSVQAIAHVKFARNSSSIPVYFFFFAS